jgi:rRNA maturation protein Nop10
MDTIASLGLVDTLVVIVAIAVAGAFLHWIYEHVVRFFSISSWRRCPECDRMILREAHTCEHCGVGLRPPAHSPHLRPYPPEKM